jgi:hypothetical protein
MFSASDYEKLAGTAFARIPNQRPEEGGFSFFEKRKRVSLCF